MVSPYTFAIPTFIRYLNNLSAVLKKGQKYAQENGISEEKVFNTKLAPDMQGLAFQVQLVSDIAKGTAIRVGGIDEIPLEDNETNFEECQARIQKTIDILNTVDQAAFDSKETAEVKLKGSSLEKSFTGVTFLTEHAFPNFFFHVATAYDILRHVGAPLSKMDYLGWAA